MFGSFTEPFNYCVFSSPTKFRLVRGWLLWGHGQPTGGCKTVWLITLMRCYGLLIQHPSFGKKPIFYAIRFVMFVLTKAWLRLRLIMTVHPPPSISLIICPDIFDTRNQWFIQTPQGGYNPPVFMRHPPTIWSSKGVIRGVYGGSLCDRDGRGQILTWTNLFTLWNK